jgi:hypothetical protein
MKNLTILCIFWLSSITFGQQPDFQKERRFFDFLIGEWKIQNIENSDEKRTGGEDTFKFAKALDGNAITSEWYFNRGTQAKPNFTKALYFMGFDNSSQSWTFYYISPQSSQFYQGKFENDNWSFYRNYSVNGKTILQRQNWRITGDGLLQRTIENSEDNGKTWTGRFNKSFFRKVN